MAEPPTAPEGALSQDEAPVVIFNRTVTVLRAPFLGYGPKERARRAAERMTELLERQKVTTVTVKAEPQGNMLLVDGSLAFMVTEGDTDKLTGQTLENATDVARVSLERVIAETREAHNQERFLRAMLRGGAATLALLLAVLLTWRVRSRLIARVHVILQRKMERVPLVELGTFQGTRLFALVRHFVQLVTTLLVLLFVYRWTSFVLEQFPYTRPWAEQLDSFLLGVAQHIGGGILSALPNLLIALVIFILARTLIDAIRPIFAGIEHSKLDLRWVDADTAKATNRLVNAAIWLFAGVMAYPYLPGSGSDAFKGMSVVIGVMITLGGSGLFGQAASGLMLMYSRTVRVGEVVRIGEHEGQILVLGPFTTKLRTAGDEVVSLPNSVVLSTVTKNFSRPSHGEGLLLDRTVTIGYDAPWRQVEAMLIEAARRTEGVLSDPAPRVLQPALSDFYVEYRLVCQAAPNAGTRPHLLTLLSAHIQDVFNEYGVQIMSPHYYSDPAEPKVVPKDAWYPPPVEKPRQG
jgi:small-conductance mechanosensitive channel